MSTAEGLRAAAACCARDCGPGSSAGIPRAHHPFQPIGGGVMGAAGERGYPPGGGPHVLTFASSHRTVLIRELPRGADGHWGMSPKGGEPSNFRAGSRGCAGPVFRPSIGGRTASMLEGFGAVFRKGRGRGFLYKDGEGPLRPDASARRKETPGLLKAFGIGPAGGGGHWRGQGVLTPRT